MSRLLAITGPPHSGKSQLTELVAAKAGLHDRVIRSGRLAYNLAAGDPKQLRALQLGLKFESEEVLGIAFSNELQTMLAEDRPVIVDGLPRFANQLEWLNIKGDSADVKVVLVDPGSLESLNMRAATAAPSTLVYLARRATFFAAYPAVVQACLDYRFGLELLDSSVTNATALADWLTEGTTTDAPLSSESRG